MKFSDLEIGQCFIIEYGNQECNCWKVENGHYLRLSDMELVREKYMETGQNLICYPTLDIQGKLYKGIGAETLEYVLIKVKSGDGIEEERIGLLNQHIFRLMKE